MIAQAECEGPVTEILAELIDVLTDTGSEFQPLGFEDIGGANGCIDFLLKKFS
jgi:hypothetical protein